VLDNRASSVSVLSLPVADRENPAVERLPEGLDRARIPVRVWARDPISLAGLTSALVCRPELKIVDVDRGAQARVALIAADSLDESVLSMLRAMKAQGCRTVLVVSTLTDDDVLAVVDAGVCAVVWRWEATATWLSQVVAKAAAGQPVEKEKEKNKREKENMKRKKRKRKKKNKTQ